MSRGAEQHKLWLELAAGVIAAVASALVVAHLAKGTWFQTDAWDYLAYRDLSIGSILRPHSGHWTAPTVIFLRFLYRLFGMEYWPWYSYSRLLVYPAVIFFLWRILRWRGVDSLLAFAVYLVLLFFGLSGWHSPATLGISIVYSSLLVIAWLVSTTPAPTNRARVVLGLLLLLAVSSDGRGVAVLAGTLIAIVVSRRFLLWWQPLLSTFLIFVTWNFSLNASSHSRASLTPGTFLEIPQTVLEILSKALTNALAVPDSFGPTLTVLLAAAIIWLLRSGRLGIYEGVFFATLGVYMVMLILARIAPGRTSADTPRYSYTVALLLIPALVPHLKLPARSTHHLVVVGLVAMLGLGNFARLERSLAGFKAHSQKNRPLVESCASLLAAGEPAVPTASIEPKAMLDASGLKSLVDEGWSPPASPDPAVVERARGRLRMAHPRRRWIAGVPPRPGEIGGVPPTTHSAIADGCARARPDQPLAVTITGSATIRLEAPKGTAVELLWEDTFGQGVRSIIFGKGRLEDSIFVHLSNPPGSAALTFNITDGQWVRVCGLAPPRSDAGGASSGSQQRVP